MKKNIKTLINLMILSIIIFNIYKTFNIINEYTKARETTKKVQFLNTSKEKSLSEINNDFKFWITVDNTNIDYPVMQGNDNEFYLNHDFFKEKSISGSVFLDYRNNSDSKNSIIYAHNMKDNSMFSDLELFKEKDFFNKNNLIKITKNNKLYIYEIFSVYYISGYETYHLQTNFDSNTDFFNYLQLIESKSLFKSNKELDTNNIITLSTCSYEFKNCRTVVHAQLIEEK